MKVFTEKYKLSYRTNEVVDGFFVGLLQRADRAGIVFGEKTRPKRTHIINALFLWLQSQPETEQKRIVSEGIALLNALALDEPSEAIKPGAKLIPGRPAPKRHRKSE